MYVYILYNLRLRSLTLFPVQKPEPEVCCILIKSSLNLLDWETGCCRNVAG